MTQEEQDKMKALCRRIAVETDSKTFDALVVELNELLDTERSRLRSEQENASR